MPLLTLLTLGPQGKGWDGPGISGWAPGLRVLSRLRVTTLQGLLRRLTNDNRYLSL